MSDEERPRSNSGERGSDREDADGGDEHEVEDRGIINYYKPMK